MPRKCKVFGCRNGYKDDTDNVPGFRFPSEREGEREGNIKEVGFYRKKG